MTNIKEILSRIQLNDLIPYIAAIALFLIMTLVYVNPVLEGKRLQQPDIVNWQGMSKEIADFRQETGEEPLWTNSMFGGMPSFQITAKWANNIANFFHSVITLGLPSPADKIFLYFLGFFFFLLMLKVNPWIAMAGAIGFALSSYHFIIIEAGHNTKAFAIGYMAPVLGSIIYTFRGNILGGGILFTIFMGLQLFANHFQITYYLAIIVLIYGIAQLHNHIRDKKAAAFFKKTGILLAGLIIAIGINIGNFWGTYSYASETMRGGSELTIIEETQTSGLSKEYITNWSYGKGETFSLLIPNVKGGASGAFLIEELIAVDQGSSTQREKAEKTLQKYDDKLIEHVIDRYFERQPVNTYWGNQPGTSGPVYVGAVVLFFFFLSLFLVKGPLKWGLLIATILSIMLAWGKNFMPLTDFFIDYVPGYNKFRAVSMTLVIAELCIPALAFLGLYRLYEKPELLTIKSKAFITAIGLTAGLALLFYIAPRQFFSFTSQMENAYYESWATMAGNQAMEIKSLLESARANIFRADALRSFMFALLTGTLTLLFLRKTITKTVFIALVMMLVTVDMWTINRRYLNDDNFVPRRIAERPFERRTADQYILQDDEEFRVLDLTVRTFNNTHTSYFHHSIGGYHGAKLQRYQELIDFHINNERNRIQYNLFSDDDQIAPPHHLAYNPVLNMLNTRYIIFQSNVPPLHNPYAAGNAWFVTNYSIVENADEEIQTLKMIDILDEALIDRRFADHVEGKSFTRDPAARIDLIHYQPNKLIYEYSASSEQLAVFSEVYYPEGWEVRINGEDADHFRVNYILRAMVLPEGEHTIEFSFRPAPYYTGRYIALFFSSLLVLATGGFAYYSLKNRSRIETD